MCAGEIEGEVALGSQWQQRHLTNHLAHPQHEFSGPTRVTVLFGLRQVEHQQRTIARFGGEGFFGQRNVRTPHGHRLVNHDPHHIVHESLTHPLGVMTAKIFGIQPARGRDVSGDECHHHRAVVFPHHPHTVGGIQQGVVEF